MHITHMTGKKQECVRWKMQEDGIQSGTDADRVWWICTENAASYFAPLKWERPCGEMAVFCKGGEDVKRS